MVFDLSVSLASGQDGITPLSLNGLSRSGICVLLRRSSWSIVVNAGAGISKELLDLPDESIDLIDEARDLLLEATDNLRPGLPNREPMLPRETKLGDDDMMLWASRVSMGTGREIP